MTKFRVSVRYLVDKLFVVDAPDEAEAEEQAMILFETFEDDGEYITTTKEVD